MRQDEGNDMLFRYLILVPDTFCFKMMQELTQIQTIVANRDRTATQVGQVLDQFFHFLPDFTVKPVENRRIASFAYEARKQHVIKHLDATDLFTLLRTNPSVVMTGVNEHSSNAWVIHFEALCLHKRDNAAFPKSLVHTNSILCVVLLLKESNTLLHKLSDVFFFHNIYIFDWGLCPYLI